MKQKVSLTPGTAAKKGNDPLLAVLKLKKSTFPGFIREVVCNDLPTIMLYTDSQPEKIVKFVTITWPGFLTGFSGHVPLLLSIKQLYSRKDKCLRCQSPSFLV